MTSKTYRILVEVTRDLGDDLECTRAKYPNVPDSEALALQLADELQTGWDMTGIAGTFQVYRSGIETQ